MKLTVLGSSSSGNGYILEASDETLLLECGCHSKDLKEVLNFDLSKVVGALVSHSHGDHAGHATSYMMSGIPVYMSGETSLSLKNSGKGCSLSRELTPGVEAVIGGFRVIPFSVKHDVPCLGFLINHEESGNILFVTDTHFIPNKFRNLNHVLIEANYEEAILNDNIWNGVIDAGRARRTQTSHMSLETCIEALKANDLTKVQNIVLIHLSSQNSNAGLFRERVIEATGKKTFVAKRGLEINLDKTPF